MKATPRAVALLAGLALLRPAAAVAQASFEATIKELSSADAGTRLRAATLLEDAAYPEAAVPLAKAVVDPDDRVRLHAIAGELNIFLARRIVPRRRIGYVIEVRNRIAADAAFSAGPDALGARPVPLEVIAALRDASQDDHPRMAVEALYAFGTLAPEASGSDRAAVLRASAPVLASMIGASDPSIRYGAVRVIGRLFAARPADPAIDVPLGDAVIAALNDSGEPVRLAAMEALGAMRYGRAVQALTELFRYDRHGAAAEAALDALARIAHPASVPLFEEQLASKDAALRASAIAGLARAADRAKAGDIQRIASADHDPRVELAGAFAAAALSGAPLDPLVDALRQGRQRDAARDDLIELVPARVSDFGRYAQDPDAAVREALADAIGLSGDRSARVVIDPLLKDPDPAVAAAAARAAMRLGATPRPAP